MKTETTPNGHTIYRLDESETRLAVREYLARHCGIVVESHKVITMLTVPMAAFGLLVEKQETRRDG